MIFLPFPQRLLTICVAAIICWSCQAPPTTAQTDVAASAQNSPDVPVAAAAQGDVPAVVAQAFAVKYPTVRDAEWQRDRNDSYEAHFVYQGVKLRADFTPTGSWIETERSIKWDELPNAVQESIKSEYDKDDIVELEFTQNAKRGDFYDVEIDPKGEKKFDVEYRADGTVLKRE